MHIAFTFLALSFIVTQIHEHFPCTFAICDWVVWWECITVEPVVMRRNAQQYPTVPFTHGFPVVVPAGSVAHHPVMHIPPASVGLQPSMHPHYAFQPSVYGMPVVRCCIRFQMQRRAIVLVHELTVILLVNRTCHKTALAGCWFLRK